jgi:hypothetical protein
MIFQSRADVMMAPVLVPIVFSSVWNFGSDVDFYLWFSMLLSIYVGKDRLHAFSIKFDKVSNACTPSYRLPIHDAATRIIIPSPNPATLTLGLQRFAAHHRSNKLQQSRNQANYEASERRIALNSSWVSWNS